MSATDPVALMRSRRAFLNHAGRGMGTLALASLLSPRLHSAPGADGKQPPRQGGVVQPLHHPAKAKRVIWLYMAGGPSHLETFDPKPTLTKMDGKPIPPSVLNGQEISPNGRSTKQCVAPMFPFKQCGRSGHAMTTLFPHLATVADELCMVRSMKTDSFVHDLAHTFISTGSLLPGRPSVGSWLWYGLGTESEDLPGFVVLRASSGSHPLNKDMWSNGFLPTHLQGVQFRTRGDVVHYLSNLKGVSSDAQRDAVRAVQELDRLSPHAAHDPEVLTHVAQYETAFRMQASVPGLVDFSGETKQTLRMYGVNGIDGSFASNCLLARRLSERGVRVVEIVHLDWDHHNNLRAGIQATAKEVDRGVTALIKDLKRRGLLDETLVIWGGEFGRTPVAQEASKTPGRDHHNKCFTLFLAGGGVKAGHAHGETDEFGCNVVKDAVHVHDLHATILHQMGINHERLTFRYQGRDFRLTDVAGKVVREILA